MNWRKSGSAAALVIFLSLVVAPAARGDAADEAAIKTLQQNFVIAVKAKDIDGLMKYYVPDDTLFVFDVVPPREFVGAAAYRKDWEEFLTSIDGQLTFEMSDFALTADGNMAFAHSIQRAAGKTKDGNDFDFTTRVTDVFRKIDGKWLVVHEHLSVPVDLVSGSADLNSKP